MTCPDREKLRNSGIYVFSYTYIPIRISHLCTQVTKYSSLSIGNEDHASIEILNYPWRSIAIKFSAFFIVVVRQYGILFAPLSLEQLSSSNCIPFFFLFFFPHDDEMTRNFSSLSKRSSLWTLNGQFRPKNFKAPIEFLYIPVTVFNYGLRQSDENQLG